MARPRRAAPDAQAAREGVAAKQGEEREADAERAKQPTHFGFAPGSRQNRGLLAAGVDMGPAPLFSQVFASFPSASQVRSVTQCCQNRSYGR